MWQQPRPYPFLAVIEYNTHPVVPGPRLRDLPPRADRRPDDRLRQPAEGAAARRAALAPPGRRARDRDRHERAATQLNARAAAGTLLFLVLVPGTVAGLIPWLLTGWEVRDTLWPPIRVVGVLLLAAGVAVLLHAFLRFVVEGVGTPAPIAPTKHLVVGGLYRYVRNPMYLAVAATIVGQALALGQLALLVYAAVFAVTVYTFVRTYEEPTLRQQFGEQYEEYRRAVPGWWPRRTPWSGRQLDERSLDALRSGHGQPGVRRAPAAAAQHCGRRSRCARSATSSGRSSSSTRSAWTSPIS